MRRCADRLHLRHHRPAEGRDLDPRQPDRRLGRDDRAGLGPACRRRDPDHDADGASHRAGAARQRVRARRQARDHAALRCGRCDRPDRGRGRDGRVAGADHRAHAVAGDREASAGVPVDPHRGRDRRGVSRRTCSAGSRSCCRRCASTASIRRPRAASWRRCRRRIASRIPARSGGRCRSVEVRIVDENLRDVAPGTARRNPGALRRARRALGHARLLPAAGGERRGFHRRLAAHRRCRPHGRRRLPLFRRPRQGHDRRAAGSTSIRARSSWRSRSMPRLPTRR